MWTSAHILLVTLAAYRPAQVAEAQFPLVQFTDQFTVARQNVFYAAWVATALRGVFFLR